MLSQVAAPPLSLREQEKNNSTAAETIETEVRLFRKDAEREKNNLMRSKPSAQTSKYARALSRPTKVGEKQTRNRLPSIP